MDLNPRPIKELSWGWGLGALFSHLYLSIQVFWIPQPEVRYTCLQQDNIYTIPVQL